MLVTKIKIATTILLMALPCCAILLTGYSSMQAGQRAPDQVPPPIDPPPGPAAKPPEKDAENKDAEKPVERCPVGLVHDFGKVTKGTQCNHAFRIVNTSGVPLRIISVRRGG
jgi:hypothetical protein